MDKNVDWLNELKVTRTIEALEKGNINGFYVKSNEELINKIIEIIPENSKVTCGGSMTLFETGVIDHLKSGRYTFLDRYKEGLTKEELKDIYIGAFSCDGYFSSSNAITEAGEIYNVDGNGNRVAALLYGPEKVIIVVGTNKIVKNIDEAIERNKRISAPTNAKRLDRNTPCTKLGYCVNCNSPEKICREYTVIKSQGIKGRINVIFIDGNFGY